jgi:succinate-semialdehyde dehydrogenase/glutarate-semialdehyde dehydrogenase
VSFSGTTVEGEQFEVIDPATGDVVGVVADATCEDVRAAIDVAERAAADWRDVPAIERGRLLRRAADLLLDRSAEVAAVMTAEQGKPLTEAQGEVRYAAGFFEWFAGEAERAYGQVVPSADPSKRVLVLRQPAGVTAAITPWNFPAAMLTRKLGPAIAAGCSSIVKPAEQTPLTAVEVCRALTDAGAPDGLVTLITSSRPQMVADELFGDARMRKLSFTGSTAVGQELIRRSAENVTRLSLWSSAATRPTSSSPTRTSTARWTGSWPASSATPARPASARTGSTSSATSTTPSWSAWRRRPRRCGSGRALRRACRSGP